MIDFNVNTSFHPKGAFANSKKNIYLQIAYIPLTFLGMSSPFSLTLQSPYQACYNSLTHAARICYDTLARLVHSILSCYERMAPWMGVGSEMMLNAVVWLGQKFRLMGESFACVLKVVFQCSLWLYHKIEILGGCIGLGVYRVSTAVAENIFGALQKTLRFFRENWKYIVAHVIAWGVVVSCSGLLYGFEAVALPLSIGFGCGFVLGGLTGILTVKIFDPTDEARGRNTAWEALNYYLLNRLPSAGVKNMLLALCVTVLVAASTVYSYAMGALFGIVIGNHALTLIGQSRNIENQSLQEQMENFRERMEGNQESFQELQRQFELLQQRVQNEHPQNN